MTQDEIKIPKKGGLDEARRILNELRRKEPSPELVEIIDEVTHQQPSKKSNDDAESGIAARRNRRPPTDLDL